MQIPYDFHRYVIGQQGKDVRRMMKEYDVNISIPPAEEHSEKVKITGAPANVKRAMAALEDKCDQLEREKEDRVRKLLKLCILNAELSCFVVYIHNIYEWVPFMCRPLFLEQNLKTIDDI